jgi:hypothetical protein
MTMMKIKDLLLGSVLALGLVPVLHAEPHGRPYPEHAFRGREWAFDDRFHHDHYYPVRGYRVAALPAGAINISWGAGHFWYHGGVWFRPEGRRYVVVAPPIGVIVPVLPPAVVTLWAGPVPYYYANDVYYTAAPGGYQVVDPPPELSAAAAAPSIASQDLIVYPRNGQSPEQTTVDRGECAQWATGQATGQSASVYLRAMSACMDARGYTVR